MPSPKKSRLDRELERAAIMLLKDAFRGNNRSQSAVATTPADGSSAPQATPDPGPTLTERAKVFEAVSRFRQIQARIEGDDDGDPGDGNTLDNLQRRLNGGASSSRTPSGTAAGSGRA